MIALSVPGDLHYRDIATRVVSAACKLVSASADRERSTEFREQVVSAFGEAFNNSVIHAYKDRPGDVRIEIDTETTGIAIRLVDQGHSFDPKTVAAPDLDALPEGGLGMYIIRAFMDEVRYEAGPPNVLFLRKRL